MMSSFGVGGRPLRSDRHWFLDGAIGETRLDRPLVLGHEVAAVIESGPRRGIRVVLDPADPCGRCPTCRAGDSELCPGTRFAGHGETDGGLRAWMTWPSRLAHAVPPSMSDAEVSLLEPLGIALHARSLGEVVPGTRCGVVGCGPIGLLVIRSLISAGVRDIVATDRRGHRVAAARMSGAAVAVEVDAADVLEAKLGGCDVVFECAGEEAAIEAALWMVRPGGRVVLVGIPSPDRMSFSASVARRKGLTLQFCRRMRGPQRAVTLVDGRIGPSGLAHAIDLSRIEAFLVLSNRGG
jgi:L-iditol 2-dehydrogenase